jgi:hypothetical protein
MINTLVGAGAVGAASRYGSGSDQKMRLLAAPAPQHCLLVLIHGVKPFRIWIQLREDAYSVIKA